MLLEGFSQLSGDYFIHLPNLASAPPPPPSINPALRCPNSSQHVRGILYVPSWAITLLPRCLGIKATICFCISDKHFIFSPPLIHLSIHPLFSAHVSVICLVGPGAHTCHPPRPIPSSDSAKSYLHSFQADTCTTFMHCSFTPASRAQPFGNQRDVTAWLICDCFFGQNMGVSEPSKGTVL